MEEDGNEGVEGVGAERWPAKTARRWRAWGREMIRRRRASKEGHLKRGGGGGGGGDRASTRLGWENRAR